jgi:hypothetical protein
VDSPASRLVGALNELASADGNIVKVEVTKEDDFVRYDRAVGTMR